MRRLLVVALASVALAGCSIPQQALSQQAPTTVASAAPTTLTAATTGDNYNYQPPATNGYGLPLTTAEKNFLIAYYAGVGRVNKGECPTCDARPDSPIISDSDRVGYGWNACSWMTSGDPGWKAAEVLKRLIEERTNPSRHLHSEILVAAAGLWLCPENEKQLGAT